MDSSLASGGHGTKEFLIFNIFFYNDWNIYVFPT
jgi:hypothetical protein